MTNGVKISEDIFKGRNKKIMLEIIGIVINSSKTGIGHQELARRLDMHRDTLRKFMKRFLESGLIIRESKKDKYHFNSKYYDKSNIGGKVLKSVYLTQVLGHNNISPNEKRVMIGSDYYSKKPKQNESYGRVVDIDTNILKNIVDKAFTRKSSNFEKVIYEFANQMGAYIVFVFLLSVQQYHLKIDSSDQLTEEGKLWLRQAVSESVVESYYKFRDIILDYDLDENEKREVQEYIRKNKLSINETNEKLIYGQMCLSRLYPIIYLTLQDCDDKIVEDIKVLKNDLLTFAKNIRKEDEP